MADRPMGCGVIQDLLPLYVDGAAGEESRALVEEHLRSCSVCRRELEQLRGRVVLPPETDGGEVRAWEKGIRRRLERRVTAAAAGVVLLLIAAMLAASQFVRFGIPGWQLAERDRGEEGQPVVLSEARNGDMAFFLYQEGSSLRYTYYENEPGLDFGYHFRASGTGHEETGVYVVQHGETLLVVSLNRVEEVEGIEVTDPESGTVRQTYPVAPGEPFAVLVTLGEGAEDLALRAVDRRGETVPFENYYVR